MTPTIDQSRAGARANHRARVRPPAVVAGALVALLAAACASAPATPDITTPEATGGPTRSPTALARPVVVVDTDLSGDDTMALPFLLREPGIDVAAVTVVGTGLVHCAQGLEGVVNLMATLQVSDIPTTCGRDEPLAGDHAFPEEWRAAADDQFGLDLERRPVSMLGQDAPDLIAAIAGSSAQPITIVALGPLTNIAEALQRDAGLAGRIDRIVAMSGAVDVAGNVSFSADESNPLPAEWNVYADPTAADIVLRSGVPVTLVPLDATNHVPLDAAFLTALESDHAAAPADIAYELIMRRGLLPGEYLWDPLAAVIAVDESVAQLETIPLRVETGEGPDSGRTVRDDNGTAIRVATSADRDAFEARFLAGLRIGEPRPRPFQLTGSFAAAFDGEHCTDEAPDTLAAGNWMVNADVTAEATTVLVVVRFHEGAGWSDLVDYFATAQDPTNQPSFVDAPFFAFFEGPGSGSLLAAVTPGEYGLVCLYFTDAQSLAFPGSGLFTVEP